MFVGIPVSSFFGRPIAKRRCVKKKYKFNLRAPILVLLLNTRMKAALEKTECATREDDERPRPALPPLSIRISDELDGQINAAVKKTGLKRSDVARKGLERGIPVLLAQLAEGAA